MRRWIPAPWVSLAIFVGWLLLARTPSVAQALLGAAVALTLPWLAAPLRPRPGPLRRYGVLARLVLRVGRDVVRSAIQVALGVLRLPARAPRGRFVVIPLALRDPHALAALAMIVTVVPGTVWSELAADRSALLIHVFDLDDEAAFIAHFRRDYEQALQEIFE